MRRGGFSSWQMRAPVASGGPASHVERRALFHVRAGYPAAVDEDKNPRKGRVTFLECLRELDEMTSWEDREDLALTLLIAAPELIAVLEAASRWPVDEGRLEKLYNALDALDAKVERLGLSHPVVR